MKPTPLSVLSVRNLSVILSPDVARNSASLVLLCRPSLSLTRPLTLELLQLPLQFVDPLRLDGRKQLLDLRKHHRWP